MGLRFCISVLYLKKVKSRWDSKFTDFLKYECRNRGSAKTREDKRNPRFGSFNNDTFPQINGTSGGEANSTTENI